MGHENTPTFFYSLFVYFFFSRATFFSQDNSVIQGRKDAMVLVKTKKAPMQTKCTTA